MPHWGVPHWEVPHWGVPPDWSVGVAADERWPPTEAERPIRRTGVLAWRGDVASCAGRPPPDGTLR